MNLFTSWLVLASILRVWLFHSSVLNNLLDRFSLLSLRKIMIFRKKMKMTHSRIAMLLALLLLRSRNRAGKIQKPIELGSSSLIRSFVGEKFDELRSIL
jgi:hypothetical protein